MWQRIGAGLTAAADWISQHQDELHFLGVWANVGEACRKARLYAPIDLEAWQQIQDLTHRDPPARCAEYEALIVSLYGPGGVGWDSLRCELGVSALLSDRQREVEEVLASLADGRNYITVCGALPLVEYVLAKAAGKWNDPSRHPLAARLDEPGAISPDDEAGLLIDAAGVTMVLTEIPELWKPGRHSVGAVSDKLNRHFILHGTGTGWNDTSNATRAVLLLAAAARVAGPLLAPGLPTRL